MLLFVVHRFVLALSCVLLGADCAPLHLTTQLIVRRAWAEVGQEHCVRPFPVVLTAGRTPDLKPDTCLHGTPVGHDLKQPLLKFDRVSLR